MFIGGLSVVLALVLDWKYSEPRRWHPLVGFGNLANKVEARLNKAKKSEAAASKVAGRLCGLLAWSIVVLPFVWLAYFLVSPYSPDESWGLGLILELIVGASVLYLALGWQSLIAHARAISEPLGRGDLDQARTAVGMIVSRDTSCLEEEQVAAAATESVLENGADAVFAALFWFLLLGVPGVVLYRLTNTLDAMWGYKNERYIWFGWAAARMDDLLNFIPARLTAISYSLAGDHRLAWASWRDQSGTWKSPNAGPVMASGAGAINVSLGGGAIYHGQWQERPTLGPKLGDKASAESINKAIRLVNQSLAIWLVAIFILSLMGVLL